jgi:hypothetical protein
MWEDEIVKEIRKYREDHAKKFNFDIKAIYEDLKERETENRSKKITLQPRKHLKQTKVFSE